MPPTTGGCAGHDAAHQISLELLRPTRLEARGLRHLAIAVYAVEPVRVDEFTGKRFAFFTDPDGLPLELCEA